MNKVIIDKDVVLSEVYIGGRRFIDKIVVLSKTLAEQFRCDKLWTCISISTYKMFANIHGANRIALLQMAFPDIDLPRLGWEPFTYEQAHEVYNFIDPLWKPSEVVMLHCEAGLSRSAAIAAALHKVYVGGDNNLYWKYYIPNALVYKTMLKVAVERGLWDPTANPDTPHGRRPTADPDTTNLFGD